MAKKNRPVTERPRSVRLPVTHEELDHLSRVAHHHLTTMTRWLRSAVEAEYARLFGKPKRKRKAKAKTTKRRTR